MLLSCLLLSACSAKDQPKQQDASAHDPDAGEEAELDAGTRVQATRAARDAGTRAARDAGQQDARDAGAQDAKKPAQKSAAAGTEAKPARMEPKPAQEDAGAAAKVTCDEKSCAPCQACNADTQACEPVTGRDDADSCSDTHSCGSTGSCLSLSESHTSASSNIRAQLTTTYAQVIDFSEPASIVEIRLDVSCSESEQTFPAVWIAAAPSGVPTTTTLATATVLHQPGSTFALLELSKVLEEPAAGPLAIVVAKTAMQCSLRLDAESGTGLFAQGSLDLWAPTEGSMVFQVLAK